MKLASFAFLTLALQSQSAFSSVFNQVDEEFEVVEEQSSDQSCVVRIGERIRNLEEAEVQALEEGDTPRDRTLASSASSQRRHRRAVSINLPIQSGGCNAISVDIPHDGVQMTFSKKKSKSSQVQDGAGGTVGSTFLSNSKFSYWSGREETNGSIFDFVQDDEGHMAGSLVDVTNHNVLQFHSDHNGEYAVTITRSSDFPPEDDPLFHDEGVSDVDNGGRMLRAKRTANSNDASLSSSSDQLIQNTADSPTLNSIKKNLLGQANRKLYDDLGGNLDVMVVWTKKSECDYNNLPLDCTVTSTTEANMMALVELAVQETNTGYQNSGVDTELLLVKAYRHPTYVEQGFSGSLSALKNGDVPDVHDKRSTYGADIVALIIDDPQYCGIAYLGPSINSMFSVTAYNCATGYYSFGHEIGHNFGCNHDRGTKNACTNSEYRYGWRDPQARFRTVLAYNCASGQCDSNAGGGCSRVNWYSNPNTQYNGMAVGNASNDNARRINDVKATVAAYYPHSLTTPSPVPITPAPTSSPIVITPTPTKQPSPWFCGDGVCQVTEGEGCGFCPSDCSFPTDCGTVTNNGSAVQSSGTFGLVFDAVVGSNSLYFYEFQVYLMKDATATIYMKNGSHSSDPNLDNWTEVFDGSISKGGTSRQNVPFQSRFFAQAGSTVAFYISYTEGAAFAYSRDSLANDDITIQNGDALRQQTDNTLPFRSFSGRYLLELIRYDYGTGSTLAPVPSTPAPVPSTPAPVPSTPAPSTFPSKSTPAPVPSTPAPVPSTPAPVPSTPAPVPSTPAPVPSTSAPVGSPTSNCSCCDEVLSKIDNMEAEMESQMNNMGVMLESITNMLASATPAPVAFADTPAPVASPTPAPIDCTDRTDTWRINGTGNKRNWCNWAKGAPTNRCRNKNLYNDCPKTCTSACS